MKSGENTKLAAVDQVATRAILDCLSRIESEHDVRVLYACESGSRAWGFASPDSDYDVRYVYAHDRVWYLSFDVERRRDVIERPIQDAIDCQGWDLRKALHLFTRTNGALLEWLNSPIRYVERGGFAEALRQLAPRHLNAKALCYHYSHLARGNAREYVFKGQIRLKKYFYVLRALLAIRYIESGRGIPPVLFEELVDAVAPEGIRPSIASLLESKRGTVELGHGEPILELEHFIRVELERHEDAFSGLGRPDLIDPDTIRVRLNEIFREALPK